MAALPSRLPFTAFKAGVIICAFFAFLSWLLLLGGISALESVCNSGCRNNFGLPWFIIWFQFVLVIPVIAIEFFDRGAWRPTLMLLLAINTVLAIIEADRFLNFKDDTSLNGGNPYTGSRINAAIAGFIILSIFNLLLILLSGSRTALETRYGEDRDVGVATYPTKTRPTTPATNQAPQVTVPPPQSNYGANPTTTTSTV